MIPSKEIQGSACLVWAWDDAPEELQAYSEHGGDEDWLVLVPAGQFSKEDVKEGNLPYWMEVMDSCHRPSVHWLKDGRLLLISAH